MGNLLIVLLAKYLFLVSILIAVIYILKAPKQIQKKLLIFTSISFTLTFIVAKISSYFINDSRPFVTEHIKPLIAHAPDNGFPSDHTLLTMAIASVVFAYNKKLGIVLFLIALIIGATRILAHIHHPLDILGSTVIAVGITYIVYLIQKANRKKHE